MREYQKKMETMTGTAKVLSSMIQHVAESTPAHHFPDVAIAVTEATCC